MICKHCGMESETTDRCSVCGLTLTATPADAEAAVAKTSEEKPSATGSRKKLNPARPPAPAGMPRGKSGAGYIPAPPLPPGSSRPAVPDFKATAQAAQSQPHSSLTDPLSETTLYAEPLAVAPTGPTLLNPDAEPLPPVETAPDPTVSLPVGPPLAAGASPAVGAAQTAPAATGRQSDEPEEDAVGDPDTFNLTARYAGVFMLILAAMAGIASLARHYYVAPLLIAQFAGALLLPVMRVVPWADEDSDDLVLFVLLTLMFGPLVSLVIYVLLGLIRQSVNPAVVGCMIVAALSRLAIQLALGHISLTQTMPFAQIGEQHLGARLIVSLLINWSGLIALVGWYAASPFHKLDE